MTITITHPAWCDQDTCKDKFSGAYDHTHHIATLSHAFLDSAENDNVVVMVSQSEDSENVGELQINILPTEFVLNSEQARQLADALLQAADQFDEIAAAQS